MAHTCISRPSFLKRAARAGNFYENESSPVSSSTIVDVVHNQPLHDPVRETTPPTGAPPVHSLSQLQRAWDDLDRMIGLADGAIARIEICRRDLVVAKEELASAIDRLVAPQYHALEEWMFCPECNAGPGEEHSVHCSLEHGPELEQSP